MDTILDALQEGRLIELPDNDKTDCLELLSHIIEAIPSVPRGIDVVNLVLEREKVANTALGKHFACPHARVPYEDDLICSVGWSPNGIDYGAPDNLPVHIIILYLVPSNQKNHYLREISLLAKTLMMNNNFEIVRKAKDLDDIRNYLLDMIRNSKDLVGFESRAKMIQLESRTTPTTEVLQTFSNVLIEPVTIVTSLNQKPIVLCNNKELMDLLDTSPNLIENLSGKGYYEQGCWRIIKRSATIYQGSRSLFDCIAIKLLLPNKN